MLEIKGFIPFSIIDFPSRICSVIFLGGCNFRCPWCHNLDLVYPERLKNIKDISFDYVIDHINKRYGKIDSICISGGEPTIHGNELVNFLMKLKKEGILIKLDTNGSNPQLIRELIELKIIDFIALDIKNVPERYTETIGLEYFDFSKIYKSIEILKNSNIEFQVRTTLVDNLVDIEKMKNFAKKAGIELVFQEFRKIY